MIIILVMNFEANFHDLDNDHELVMGSASKWGDQFMSTQNDHEQWTMIILWSLWLLEHNIPSQVLVHVMTKTTTV